MRPGRLALCELLVLLLVLVVAHLAAGASDGPESQTGDPTQRRHRVDGSSNRADAATPIPTPAARCPAAQHAISRYRRQYTRSRNTMGLPGAVPRVWYPCPVAKRRATEWRARAHAASLELASWHHNQYAWQHWLPSKWYRVARCETGVNWQHDSGTYVSAFGIYRPGYADDAHRIGNMGWDETVRARGTVPTPREQFEAALSHYRAHGGFSGWGCRGA